MTTRNTDKTARAVYTDEQLIRDGALAMRVDQPAFKEWLAEERRMTLEAYAVQLFIHCENYSQRAMRLRAALLDLPDEEEEDD